MTKIQKSVFLTYHEADLTLAQSVFEYLSQQDFDIVMMLENLLTENSAKITANLISSSTHFLLLISPTCLSDLDNPESRLITQIQHAIETKRNITFLIKEGFNWNQSKQQINEKFPSLSDYESVFLQIDYFPEAMERLIEQLDQPTDIVLSSRTQLVQDLASRSQQQALIGFDGLDTLRQKPNNSKKPQDFESMFHFFGFYARVIQRQIVKGWKALQASHHTDSGLLLHQQGKYKEAISLYNKAIQLNPKYVIAYNHLAWTYLELENFDETFVNANYAIFLDSRLGHGYSLRGCARHQHGDLHGAIHDFSEAIERNPKYDTAYLNKAMSRTTLRDYDGAIQDFTKSIELNPKNADTYFNRAGSKLGLHQYYDAIQDLDRAIKLDPKFPEFYSLRALAKFSYGDFVGTIEDANSGIMLEPNDATNYHYRAMAYHSRGKWDATIQDCTRCIELHSNDYEAFFYRALAYKELGNCEVAIEDFSTAISLKPNYTNALTHRGHTYLLLKNYEAVIEDFNRVLELSPDYAFAYQCRGIAKRKMDNTKAAIDDLKQAISLEPDTIENHLSLAAIYSEMNDFDNAIEVFTKVIQLKPDNALAYNNRAWAKYENDNLSTALEDVTKSLELEPDTPHALHTRGAIYAAMNNVQEAINDFEHILRIDPDHQVTKDDLEKARAKLIDN